MAARRLRITSRDRAKALRACERHAADLPDELTPKGRAAPIRLPITPAEVSLVASPGFPLWEDLPTLQLRNHRITLAYGNLSHQLARRISGSDTKDLWDANWCTFATWSSKTIGTCIDAAPEHEEIDNLLRRLPSTIRRVASALMEGLLTRDHGAIYRTLAVGNRLVFLEIATAVSQFLAAFPDDASATTDGFERYVADLDVFLESLRQLDPSWVTTPAPDPTLLRSGMRAYFGAMSCSNRKERAELVLLGSLLLGAYEQMRVDTYLTATLSFFTATWLDRIIRGPRPGYLAAALRAVEAPISTVYALLATRFFLVLELPSRGGGILRVGKPVPAVDPGKEELTFPSNLQHIQTPALQATLTRFDLSDGDPARTRASNWARYADRMNYITNLFRSRQEDVRLFTSPWTQKETNLLAEGWLPG